MYNALGSNHTEKWYFQNLSNTRREDSASYLGQHPLAYAVCLNDRDIVEYLLDYKVRTYDEVENEESESFKER